MQISSVLKHLTTATTLGLALTAIAASAFAQEASTGEATALTEVVVTGSRIPQPNTGAISPIQTVSQQEFKLQGTVDVETLLNNLPSVSPGDTQFSNGNAQTGVASVDLRGFGANRTLVLVDGRRMPLRLRIRFPTECCGCSAIAWL